MATEDSFSYNDGRIFKPSQLVDVLQEFNYTTMTVYGTSRHGDDLVKVEYYNMPLAFDIEVSSFYKDDNGIQYSWEEKRERLKTEPDFNPTPYACMYVWQFGINGRVFIGRTWGEFLLFTKSLVKYMALNYERRVIIYVHNLAYELGFIQRKFDIVDMFATDTRKPLYFVTKDGLEFRCSYQLASMSLNSIGKNALYKYKAQKRTGDLDYTLIRHSKTPLTKEEIGYCVGDIEVLSNYIQEQLEQYGNIARIPLTSTGVARRETRKETVYNPDKETMCNYRQTIKSLYITSVNEYNLLKRAYTGGFTHSNPYYFGMVKEDVASYDITSSYPAVIVMRKYPMSRGTKCKITSYDQFENFLKTKCCVFRVRFTHIRATFFEDNYISMSACHIVNGYGKNENGKEILPPVSYNGRLIQVNDKTTVTMCINDVQFRIIEKGYQWDKIEIADFYYYDKAYLPTPFIHCMLEFYDKKNSLKGDSTKLLLYNLSKALVNSFYGMSAEKPIKDIIGFDNKADELWTSREQNTEEIMQSLNEYNNSDNRFIFFPWAIYITTYAQEQLWKGIYAIGHDYIYSDTDSLKIMNHDRHKDFFKQFKMDIVRDITKACNHHRISIDKVCHTGNWLGDFKFEGVYTYFKTIGAKRYMTYVKDGYAMEDPFTGEKYHLSITVSGVNKFTAVPYLLEKHNGDIHAIFNDFHEGLVIPYEATGKLLHKYIDHGTVGTVTDYRGVTAKFQEDSSVHMEPTTYIVSKLYTMLQYVRGLRNELL